MADSPYRRNASSNTGHSNPSSGPLRILLVTARYLPDIGGTEIHTKELAERLGALGHDVTVLTTNLWNELPEIEQSPFVRIRRVRAWPANRDYYFAPGIYRIITRERWDIVHCQGYHTLVAPITMLAAWRTGIPFVVAFHSGGHSSPIRRAIRGPQRRALRPLLARAERLIGGSAFEAEFFQTKLNLPTELFTVVPVLAHMPMVTEPAPDSDGATLLVTIGRLERYKGHHRAIEALPLVMRRVPNARLRIVGEGPYEADLRRLAAELGVADQVEIKGVPLGHREEMAHLLHRASLVISLSEYESAGIAVQEALALRRQTLLVQTSALAELVGSPFVKEIPFGSTCQQVADAIVDQLRRPVVEEASSAPTWDACIAAYEAIYRDAVQVVRCVS
jgi:glycosyltransferase involved in cell wall biosynthesis